MKKLSVTFAVFLHFMVGATVAVAVNDFTDKPVIDIYTDEWLPYINGSGEPMSDDAVLVSLIAREAGYRLNWKYLPYKASLDLIKNNKALLSFPYFKTEDRKKQILFSEPVFEVVNQLYFNRRHKKFSDFDGDLAKFRIGKVAGYSYGEALDALVKTAVEFPTERSAIAALLSDRIDLLPITEEVADATLTEYFPNRRGLLRPIPLSQSSNAHPLHLIAPDSDEGRELIGKINKAIESLSNREVIKVTTREVYRPDQTDLAELVISEGYPAILGQTVEDEKKASYYTLPSGTSVLVLKWSDKISQASKTNGLYEIMTDLSHVLVLNGPQAGKELYVKNMHIHLR